MLDGAPTWVWAVVYAVSALATIVPLLARLLPVPRKVTPKHAADRPGEYGRVCRRHHINEGDQAPRYASPDGTALCCDQAVIAWPYPCPWHPDGKQAVA